MKRKLIIHASFFMIRDLFDIDTEWLNVCLVAIQLSGLSFNFWCLVLRNKTFLVLGCLLLFAEEKMSKKKSPHAHRYVNL